MNRLPIPICIGIIVIGTSLPYGEANKRIRMKGSSSSLQCYATIHTNAILLTKVHDYEIKHNHFLACCYDVKQFPEITIMLAINVCFSMFAIPTICKILKKHHCSLLIIIMYNHMGTITIIHPLIT